MAIPPDRRYGSLTREQLDIIADRVARGADQNSLSHWLSRIVEVGEPVRVQIEYAAHDLRTGHGAPWYAAAVAPPSDPTAAQ